MAQRSEGTVEMSPVGININKKQMDLRGSQLVINQPGSKATYSKHGPCWSGRDFLMATSWSDCPSSPRSPVPGWSWGKSRAGNRRSPGCWRPVWLPGAAVGRFLRLQVPQGRSGAAPTPARPRASPAGSLQHPLVGVQWQPLPALATPLLRPEPSGIFNWKLISPRLNRRPRQRRGTHPPAQLTLPIWDETQREPGCAAL